MSEDEDFVPDDESYIPPGTQCEWCDEPAIGYAGENPVCEEHLDQAYPID